MQLPTQYQKTSNTKQVEVQPNTTDTQCLACNGLILMIITVQMCRCTIIEVELPITQRKILSLVSSVFDPIGLFAPFSVHMRRLLKGNCSKYGQYWNNKVELGEATAFLKWREQLPIAAETSINKKYFNTAREETEIHMLTDTSEDTMCIEGYLRSQPKEHSAFAISRAR